MNFTVAVDSDVYVSFTALGDGFGAIAVLTRAPKQLERGQRPSRAIRGLRPWKRGAYVMSFPAIHRCKACKSA
jgi:hypothetical protein